MRKRKMTSGGAMVMPLQLLTIPQVADMLGIGQTKVYDLIRWHGLPAVRLDGRLRVRLSSLHGWVEERETAHRL